MTGNGQKENAQTNTTHKSNSHNEIWLSVVRKIATKKISLITEGVIVLYAKEPECCSVYVQGEQRIAFGFNHRLLIKDWSILKSDLNVLLFFY